MPSAVRLFACSMLGACVLAPSLRAEECAVTTSRASLAALSGMRISGVQVAPEGPSLPAIARPFAVLHRTSRESIVRRQLLFAAGDTVDSLLVAETLRRLRRQRLFADAMVTARTCDDSAGVLLVMHTRDSWTLRPTARLRSSGQLSLGVEEKNFLGTGRTLSLTHEMTTYGRGAAVALIDPFLFGRDVSANLRIANLAGARTLRAGVRNHEFSVFDRWRAEASLARLSYGDTASGDRTLHTVAAMALGGRRAGGLAGGAVTTWLAGVEFDSAASVLPSRHTGADARAVAIAAPVVRSFLGLDLGVMRRAAAYDTAGWIVPGGRGFLDIPLGWEAEAIVAPGWERQLGAAALKHDIWLGRLWLPRRGSVLMADAWSSGYTGGGARANAIARVSLAWYEGTFRGLTGARLTAEEHIDLDPDRRALSLLPLADYTAPAVRPYASRGRRSLAASLEHNVHVRRVGASSVVDAGAFAAASWREGIVGAPVASVQATVLGARLRVLSANGTVASVRLDVGYPVMLSGGIKRAPFATVTLGNLFDASRQRDGRRAY